MDPPGEGVPHPDLVLTELSPTTVEVVLSNEGMPLSAVSLDTPGMEAPGCSNCTALQKELDNCKRDRAFFVDIKRKMILTDTLIQKHQSKCQAFDEQQKKLQDVTMKLAQTKRDCKVLEEQLATTLKEIIPWKRDKERFLQELQDQKKRHEDLENKITAQETMIKQYESKVEQMEEEKATAESDLFVVKSDLEGSRNREKKVLASFDKTKDDLMKMRKEMSEVKKSRSSLSLKFERAKRKVSSLHSLLVKHGIRAPRMRRASATSGSEEFMEEDADDSDREQDEVNDSARNIPTKAMTPRGQSSLTIPASRVRPSPVHPAQPRQSPSPPTKSPQRRRPFPRMDFESVACLSPLPPSPSFNGEEDDHLSDNADADDVMAEVAAKIEAKLSAPSASVTKEEDASPPAVRVSPRRRPPGRNPSVESNKSKTAAESVVYNGPCRALRSGKKIPESSDSEGKGMSKLPISKASKKLQMESETGLSSSEGLIELGRPRKRGRGRPRKEDKGRQMDIKARSAQIKHPPSAPLQGKFSSLSSSEDEEERAEEGKRDGKKETSRLSGIKTRSKVKKLDPSKGSDDGHDANLDLNGDLSLSSDGESKHSAYNPRDSESSDGSSVVATRHRKRVSSDGNTLRRSSALSDSSDSDDNAERSVNPTGKVVKSVRESVKVDLETPGGSRSSSRKLAKDSKLDDEDCSKARPGRPKKRLPRLQRTVTAQHADAADNSAKQSQDRESKTQDCVKDPVVSEQVDRKEDIPSDGMKDDLKDSVSHVTRSRSTRFLRSVSNPSTSSNKASTENRTTTRSSSRDSSQSPETKVQAAMDGKSLEQKPKDTSPNQRKIFLRAGSSSARLTRSSQRKVDVADNESSNDREPLITESTESAIKSHSSQFPRKKVGMRKRSFSNSQLTDDEKQDESSVAKETEMSDANKASDNVQEERLHKEDDETASKTEGKLLLRSETEEFVVSMDDALGGGNENSNQENNNNADGQSECKSSSPEGDVKGKKKSHIRRSKRIKRSSSDSHQDNEEVPGNVETQMHLAIPEGQSVETRRLVDETLNQPSTSRNMGTTGRTSRAEPVRNQESLVPVQRDRQLSASSLPSSGRNSPISPIQEPFQGFSEMRPISPMSPERPLERVSPILPFFFDLPSFPRMVSPLPPSPPRLEQEEMAIDEQEELIDEMMPEVIPETQNQPRMISPLFPTPVPFAVSPIPEMPVPPAISPIVDIQHPPEISPIDDDQPPAEVSPISHPPPPVLDVQTQQNFSPGKSPQLPSPMNFHSVAPLDAITVRPQHSSPGYSHDKPSAIRSLSSVLDSNDNEDYRSGFSKMIARRSSGEDQLKGKETRGASQPSISKEKVGNRDGISEEPVQNQPPSNLAGRKSLNDSRATDIATKESVSESNDSSSNKPNKPNHRKGDNEERHRTSTSMNIDMGNALRKPSKREEFKMIAPSTSSSEFSEHLKRMNNQEEMTAFSRVIPHHDEKKDKAAENRARMEHKSLVSKPESRGEGLPATVLKRVAVETSRVESNDSLMETDQRVDKEVDASKKDNPSEGDHTLKAKVSKVGNLWSQMTFENNKEIKKLRRIDWNYDDDEETGMPHFKIPAKKLKALRKSQSKRPTRVQDHTQMPNSSEDRIQSDKEITPIKNSGQDLVRNQVVKDGPSTEITVGPVQDHAGPGPIPHQTTAHSDKPQEQDLEQSGSQNLDLSTKCHQDGIDGPGPSIPVPDKKNAADGKEANQDQGQKQFKLSIGRVLRNIQGQSPDRCLCPLSDYIMEFLHRQSVDLFPAIHAKCIVGNTSTQSIVSPSEEQIAKMVVLWTKEMNTKIMQHFLLDELARRLSRGDRSSLARSVTCCRLYTIICKEFNSITRARVLCYDIIADHLPIRHDLLLALAAVWPSVLKRKNEAIQPLISTLEAVVMHQLKKENESNTGYEKDRAKQISDCLVHLCNWRPLQSEKWQESHALWLIGLLKEGNMAAFLKGKSLPTLGPRCYEVIKALNLLALCQDWEWANNKLIIECLWPVLKEWSKGLTKTAGKTGGEAQEDGQPCIALATACAVMKVIGDVAQMGLATHTKSVEQLMKMLIAVLQQPSESIPWPMQLFTAQAICNLSPSNTRLASKVLDVWVDRSSNAVPKNLLERIAELGKEKAKRLPKSDKQIPKQRENDKTS